MHFVMDAETTKTSLTTQICDALREAIVLAEYAPLAKLKIDDLARRYDASSGIVREALSRLSAEGLVIALPQRGFVVAPISREDLVELTDVRVTIEKQCLAASIERGGLEWEADLLSVRHRLQRMTPPDLAKLEREDLLAWQQMHTKFHDTLTMACGNRWWLQIRRQLFTQSERYRQLSGHVPGSGRDIAAEHEAIAEATLDRDTARACDLIEAHLRTTVDLLLASSRFATE